MLFQRKRTRPIKLEDKLIMSGVTVGVEIHAPARVVWDIMVDVPAWPIIYRNCCTAGVVDRHEAAVVLQEGSVVVDRWRLPSGRPRQFCRSMTVVDPERGILTYATQIWGCTATSTHFVERLDDRTTLLRESYALCPHSFRGRLYLSLFRKWTERLVEPYLETNLHDLCQAAEEECQKRIKEQTF